MRTLYQQWAPECATSSFISHWAHAADPPAKCKASLLLKKVCLVCVLLTSYAAAGSPISLAPRSQASQSRHTQSRWSCSAFADAEGLCRLVHHFSGPCSLVHPGIAARCTLVHTHYEHVPVRKIARCKSQMMSPQYALSLKPIDRTAFLRCSAMRLRS